MRHVRRWTRVSRHTEHRLPFALAQARCRHVRAGRRRRGTEDSPITPRDDLVTGAFCCGDVGHGFVRWVAVSPQRLVNDARAMDARAVTNSLRALTALAAFAAPASAADGVWTLGVLGGTQGAGPEVAYRAGEYVGLRANAGYFSYNRDQTVNDISYSGKLKLNSFGVAADWYPAGGGFRISAGFRSNNDKINLNSTPASPVTVGNNTYTPAQVGTLSGTVKGNDFAPTLSLGYGGTLARGFTFGAELGVMFQGSPKIQNYQATGMLASDPNFQSDLQIERARVQDKMHSYQYWPIAQIELLYRF